MSVPETNEPWERIDEISLAGPPFTYARFGLGHRFNDGEAAASLPLLWKEVTINFLFTEERGRRRRA